MKAMILAAGEGSRLRPLTNDIPKVMVKIDDKPLLEYNINLAHSYGIRDIIINVHYKLERIISYFKGGKEFGVSIYYSKEKKLLGSAGGVKKVEKNLSEPFFVLYGDNFTNCNLKALWSAHKKNKTICTVAVFDMRKNKNSGIAGGRVVLNKDKTIRRFVEGNKKISSLVNAGVYVLDPKIFKYIPKGKVYDFGKDVFPFLLRHKIKIGAHQLDEKEYVFGCDNLGCYKRAQAFFDLTKSRRVTSFGTRRCKTKLLTRKNI